MISIAISRASGSTKYELYEQWLREHHNDIQIVDCWKVFGERGREASLDALRQCDGILFTGGSDVEPERYAKHDEAHRCHTDAVRDDLEFALFDVAQSVAMPILGVCRGAQLINVALGGSLIVDIPADVPQSFEHRATEAKDERHAIEVESDTILRRITRLMDGEVNSAHHQAVERLAEGCLQSAVAPDGIVEAFERGAEQGSSGILAVQWHPERLEFENPFSSRVAQYFLAECESYHHLIKSKTNGGAPGHE